MNTYGLRIKRLNRYGTDYLIAEVMTREEGEDHPKNCSDWFDNMRPKHLRELSLVGLSMEGFVTDNYNAEPSLLGYEPKFRDFHASIDLRTATKMVKTLSKLYARARKDSATTPDDWFRVVCDTLKLSFVVMIQEDGSPERTHYSDNNWHWMSIGEGRNQYRKMLTKMIEDYKESEAAKKAVA